MDAEKIAAELRERYRNQRGLTARSDYAEVPQRMLMPSVNDPGLYAVRCRVSGERIIARSNQLTIPFPAWEGKSSHPDDSAQGHAFNEPRGNADHLRL